MSFILDALRKSELERQRDAAARIMRLPVAQRDGAHVPIWITALIVLLVLSVVVLAGAAWRGWHKRPAGTATSAAAAFPPPASRPATAAAASAPKPRQATATAAAAGKQRAAQTAAPGRPNAAKASAARGSVATSTVKQATKTRRPPAPPADPATLPSADELAANGVQVPALTLQLHVYSKNPKQRFVFIDGTRYREGQKTEEGPVLVAVTPKGAVLSQDGREFFVPTQ